MDIRQATVATRSLLDKALADLAELRPSWVLVFAAPGWFDDPGIFPALRGAFPEALLSGCSTAGEIGEAGVTNGSCVITAIRMPVGAPAAAVTEVVDMADSRAAGLRLAGPLASATPPGVLVFAPGVDINGSALVEGLATGLAAGTRIMGGLAGDDGAFQQTFTLSNAGISARAAVAVALPRGLQIGHGSFGGWKPFGPARKVTRATGNILYELDGEPALAVYKRYLGEHARDLPASGLLFPLEMLGADHAAMGLIRTILGVNEADGSLVLAGDIEPGGYLRLMHASTDALVDGAETAAARTRETLTASASRGLAVLVSCVGRKLVMGGRVDEEVEAVGDVLGAGVTLAGFYSYGEISPFSTSGECKLHNQTMTITCLSEAA
jgi:hypothetical protein